MVTWYVCVCIAADSHQLVPRHPHCSTEDFICHILPHSDLIPVIYLHVPRHFNISKDHKLAAAVYNQLCVYCLFVCVLDFSHSTLVIIVKLVLFAVVVWFLPPVESLLRSKQTSSWLLVYKMIDDNKFVSCCVCELFVIVCFNERCRCLE